MKSPRVPAARNALRILNLLSQMDVPISAARIRNELELPRSSTYHLLNEMVESGFVVHLPEQQTYGLGMVAYSMANAYTQQQPLVRLANRKLEAIAEVSKGSCHLSRLAGPEVLYLQEVRSSKAVSLVTKVGVRLPATRTASGRAMLSHLPENEVRALFSIAGDENYGSFRRILDETAERGWAEEHEEISRGQSTVAVAVLDHLDRPAAAVASTFPTTVGCAEGVIEQLQKLAAFLRERMYS